MSSGFKNVRALEAESVFTAVAQTLWSFQMFPWGDTAGHTHTQYIYLLPTHTHTHTCHLLRLPADHCVVVLLTFSSHKHIMKTSASKLTRNHRNCSNSFSTCFRLRPSRPSGQMLQRFLQIDGEQSDLTNGSSGAADVPHANP